MHHVFISYRRSDREWVRSLEERLKQRRIRVWIDQNDIPVSVPWLAEVRDAIEEAALFVRCDSPAFRASAYCSAEVGFAKQLAKPQFVVTVGDDLDRCAASIAETPREISPARGRRTELRVLARDWDRAGRPRSLLVGWRYRRRLASGLEFPPEPAENEQSFLRASTTRTRVRAFFTTVVVALIVVSFTTISVLRTEQDTINNDNGQLASAYSQAQSGLNLIDQDPYSGLQAAAGDDGDGASDAHAEVISECDAEVQHIGVAPGDEAVLPVGSGSGQGTCGVVGLRTGDPADPGSWTWNHLLQPQEESIYASAVAFSAHGGSFAIGYSNGTFNLQPTVNVTPTLTDNTADGMIRDMLTLPDNDLIVVTDAGMVQRLPMCDSCISNAALAKVAGNRLALAERLGLVTIKRVSAKDLPFGPPS